MASPVMRCLLVSLACAFSFIQVIPAISAARSIPASAASLTAKSRQLSDLYGSEWLACKATWYGEQDGDGSDGGACGYGELSSKPYGKNIAAGSPVLYQDGLGCGSCYQVKCTSDPACSGDPVTVVLTDICPGGSLCGIGKPHFDLSGTAMGNMAAAGKGSDLRGLGVVDILYKRVPCSYPEQNVTIAVDQGSNPSWLELTVLYEGGPGDLSALEVKDATSQWQPMVHKWGANWGYDKAADLHGALSIRLTSGLGSLPLVAQNALPADWAPGQTYQTVAQFS